MNLSGRSVGQALRFYKLDPADLLVVCDDLSLPLGKLRIRPGGSDGGQKGLRDITAHLGTDQFPRLRIGIGERGEVDAADFVLSRFRSAERAVIDDALILATQAVAVWVTQGIDAAMNRFNRSGQWLVASGQSRRVSPSSGWAESLARRPPCDRSRLATRHSPLEGGDLLPAFTYEGMFLLDSSKAATAWDDTVKHVHDILTKHHSEIVASRQWDERRLAYTIDGHKKGTYLLTYFKTDGTNLKEIVADCHLSDVILRELVLKVHPKLADHLVNQAMTSTPNADAEGAGEDELDERPRRRRRDDRD